MRVTLAILRREVQAYFVSPIAYTVIVIFLLLAGFGYLFRGFIPYAMVPEFRLEQLGINIRNFVVREMTLWINVAIMFLLPGLSMRSFSEERKVGTAELLMTSPITTAQLVAGKFLGAMVVHALILVLTAPFVGLLIAKAEPEMAALATAYLGYLLYGGVVLAIGLFASALTENQIVALLLTYAIFLPLWLIELLIGFMGSPWDDILSGMTVGTGMRFFSQGLVDTHYLALDFGLIFIFLFLCAQVIDSSRWR